MVKVKQKRELKIKENTGISRLFANTFVRFGVAVFVSIFASIALLIFMNYLLGNFDKTAMNAAENLFRLETVVVEKDTDSRRTRVARPLPVPERPDLSELKKIIIEDALEEDSDPTGEPDQAETN